ncbi:MAG: hypothetical protein WDM92_00845 [Caulobacteraceae bacterium]
MASGFTRRPCGDGRRAAASRGEAALDEIVVTATRRGEQNLLKVPMAIDSFSGGPA